MDPIRLDKARMTKTPLPSLADEEWEALKAEEAVGGTVLFFFFTDSWQTLSSASMGLSTENNYCGLMGTPSAPEKHPTWEHAWICMCECIA